MYADSVQQVIDELGRLPGIGPKSAQRLAFHLMKVPVEDTSRLTAAIDEMKAKVRFCDRCFNLAEGELCAVCTDDRRDSSVLCVVEDPRDIVAVERTGGFRGRYHVLGGAISPIEGIGPDQLRVREMVARLEPEGVVEESIDLDGLVDADMSEGSAVEKLIQTFPGASLVDPV